MGNRLEMQAKVDLGTIFCACRKFRKRASRRMTRRNWSSHSRNDDCRFLAAPHRL